MRNSNFSIRRWLFLLFAIFSQYGIAGNFTVDKSACRFDYNTNDGICDVGVWDSSTQKFLPGGGCSLLAASQESMARPEPDNITFSVPSIDACYMGFINFDSVTFDGGHLTVDLTNANYQYQPIKFGNKSTVTGLDGAFYISLSSNSKVYNNSLYYLVLEGDSNRINNNVVSEPGIAIWGGNNNVIENNNIGRFVMGVDFK